MTEAVELQPNDGPRSSLSIGPGSDDTVGSRWEFARRFAEGIGKLAGNTSGDHWKKTERLIARMPEAAGLVGVNHLYPGVRTIEPPKSTGELPVPKCS
ncbi:hypothetical protein GW17_00049886 [Ensete ventricosum]|nr:hypothetical protein GW17_00049886 [Ensete ventricosum]